MAASLSAAMSMRCANGLVELGSEMLFKFTPASTGESMKCVSEIGSK